MDEKDKQKLLKLIDEGDEIATSFSVIVEEPDFRNMANQLGNAIVKIRNTIPTKLVIEEGSLLYSDFMTLPPKVLEWVRNYDRWNSECESFFESMRWLSSEGGKARSILDMQGFLAGVLVSFSSNPEVIALPGLLEKKVQQIIKRQMKEMRFLLDNPPQ